MKYISLLLILVSWLSSSLAQLPDIFDEQVTTASNIGATITNLGMIGNSFRGSFNVEGAPSLEYPVGSGIEHVFDGGIWIGGLKNGQISVSTGAVDDPSGYSTGKAGFEFTSKTPLRERSNLFDNPFFSPDAISHQDFYSTFTDTATNLFTGSSNIEIQGHDNPLDLSVDFTALNWNFAFANFFIILNFRITNVGDIPIDSMHIGYWADGVIRNVNITPPGGSAFFNKGGNGFVDTMDMAYEFDATGDVGFTDSYFALKYLGSEYEGNCITDPLFKTHFNTWQFRNSADPRYFFPSMEDDKYDKLKNGLNHLRPETWQAIKKEINAANNRSNLISVGPYPRLQPGETIEFALAIVCARRGQDGLPASANTPAQRAGLLQNAGWAQRAYLGEDANGNCMLDPGEDIDGNGKITRFVLPSPPNIPATKIVAGDNQIDVYWSDNSESSIDPISKEMDFEGYRLYKTAIGFDVQDIQDVLSSLNQIGTWDIPGNGLAFDGGMEGIRLDDPVTFEGDTVTYHYKYTFENIANGWQHAIALTAFDAGDRVNNLESLESAQLANLHRVFAGKPGNTGFANGDPFVYPNPYYARAEWEGASNFEEDRKLIFANLPATCEVRIYTVAGDLVDVFQHDPSYQGQDTRWHETYADPETNQFSGGEHAWDLLSADNQIIARGLYLFVVIDDETGEKKRGKFVVIK